MMSRTRFACLSLLLGQGGCVTVGPDYVPPEFDVPDAWHESVAAQMADGSNAALSTWWTTFNDPMLDQLIERARTSNLNLQIAASRVLQARDQLAIASGARMPQVGVGGQASRSKQSDDGVLQQVAPANGFEAQNIFALGFDASWELDLFGKIRRSIEAADAQYQASIETERDVLVTLLAEVALTYIEIREYGQRVDIARKNLASQQDTLALVSERYRTGLTSRLDVVQAQALLSTTEAAIPELFVLQQRALNRLAVLLGEAAGTLQSDFTGLQAIPAAQAPMGAGIPAEVLRQRPDVRAAERQLAAQTAQIGVATAALYPDFSLTGFLGQQTRAASDLFSGKATTWGISAPFQWALYDGGTIRSNIRVQEQFAKQASLNYHLVVLSALQEVEDALLAYEQNQVRLAALNNAASASAEAVKLVTVQYNSGLTEFNNVLVSERALFEVEDAQVASQAASARNLVALYKALGGGWTEEVSD